MKTWIKNSVLKGASFAFKHYKDQTLKDCKKNAAGKLNDGLDTIAPTVSSAARGYFGLLCITAMIGAGLVLLPVTVAYIIYPLIDEASRRMIMSIIGIVFTAFYILVPFLLFLKFTSKESLHGSFGIEKHKKAINKKFDVE
ncbi:MAG: hypothetical protein HRT89_25005 [Lentisphaeria bacterium]|nr:hypothetical protein [Lentisphaeria bacterium]